MRAAKGEGSIKKTDAGYVGYVPVNGQRKYFRAKTKAEAAQKRRQLILQRDTGELSTGKAPTIAEWLEHWLSISNHRDSTVAGYRQSIRAYINPELGKIRVDKLTIERLEQFYADMSARGLKGSTIHQAHSIIRVALKQAVWRGHVGRNVAALVQAPSVKKADTRTLSEAETMAVFGAAEGHPYEARYHISLQLGLRPSEATAIEWSDVDFKAGTLHVHQQLQHVNGKGTILVPLPKTVKGDRLIPLPRYILDLLWERRTAQLVEKIEAGDKWAAFEWEGKPRDFVFTQKSGAPLRAGYDTTQWHKLLVTAGVPATRRYTSRHTAASMMISNGVDPATVSEIMGHASVAFTLTTYVHAVDENKKAMAEQMDRNYKGTKRGTEVPAWEL